MKRFPTEASCVPVLFSYKWPHGFRCPNCRHPHAYVIRTRRLPLYECGSCRHQTSLTAGTIFEGSRTSLRKWIAAIWLVANPKEGINAVRLRSIIDVTYKTAWAMLHKIRTAISCADEGSGLKSMCMALLPSMALNYIPVSILRRESNRLLWRLRWLRMGMDGTIK